MDQRLLEEIARALWEEASGRRGHRIEPAALAAATDLVELYETLNEAPIAELLARFPQRVTGEDLAWYALAPGEPATQAIYVPLFRVAIEGGDLAWEGGERPARNPDPRGAAGPESEIVLLIEDDPAMQRATTRMIKRIFPSAQVLVADNYASAVGDLQAHRVAMVVSDVNILGAESGVDVFRWVQEHQPHLVDRYVFFTGGNPQVAQIHYRYLEKPASIADLRAVIEEPGPAIRNPPVRARDGTYLATTTLPAGAGDSATQFLCRATSPKGHQKLVWAAGEVDPDDLDDSPAEAARASVAAANEGWTVELAREGGKLVRRSGIDRAR